MVRASALQSGGRSFKPWLRHTEDFQKWYFLSSSLVFSIIRKGKGKPNTQKLPDD